MLKIQGSIPKDVGVAVSGGVDSMVVLDFLRRRHSVHVYHVNHGTSYGNKAMALVVDYCHQYNIPYTIEFLQKEKPKKKSWEEFWRDERYTFFKSQPHQIVMAHHLDDCVENWAMTACHGDRPHPIAYRHANVIRPFRLNRKDQFTKWAEKYQVTYLDDPTNSDPDTRFNRVYVRLFLIPNMLHVNPGLHKVVKKKMLEEVIQ
jgi:tRNA(Ile)-lysidine synthase